MSVTVVASAGRVALRLRAVSFLLALLIGSLAFAGAHAAPTRTAKCPACAVEAAEVTRLTNLREERQRALDQALKARMDAEARYRAAQAASQVTYKVFAAGTPFDATGYRQAQLNEEAAYNALPAVRERHAQAIEDMIHALEAVAQAMSRLEDCEANKCVALGDPQPRATMRAIPPPPPPGSYVAMRPAACPACNDAAARRNYRAELLNQSEAQMQRLRNGIARARERKELGLADGTRFNQLRNRRSEARVAGAPERPDLEKDLRLLVDRALDEQLRADSERQRLEKLLEQQGAYQAKLQAAFVEADNQLTDCERRMCARPQADAQIIGPSEQLKILTIAPAATIKEEVQVNAVQIQLFGGFAIAGSRLTQTGSDVFFGAPLIDQRSSDAAQGVFPVVGAIGRFKIADTDAVLPASRVIFSAGGLFPIASRRGFDATGINAVPQGDVRSEVQRNVMIPAYFGFEKTFFDGRLSVEVGAGVMIGHDTVRVAVLREGGAPAGLGAYAQSSAFYVDPLIVLAASTPLGEIAGVGPVRLGVMSMVTIGTGGLSARAQSQNFGSQSYTVEYFRRIQATIGATVTVGLF